MCKLNRARRDAVKNLELLWKKGAAGYMVLAGRAGEPVPYTLKEMSSMLERWVQVSTTREGARINICF